MEHYLRSIGLDRVRKALENLSSNSEQAHDKVEVIAFERSLGTSESKA